MMHKVFHLRDDTDSMYQEKEEEFLPALRVASMQLFWYSKNIQKKQRNTDYNSQ